MSFNKINLPEILLADLYKEGLVVIDKEIRVPKKEDAAAKAQQGEEMILINKTVAKTPDNSGSNLLAFLGNNQKSISIIVKDEHAIHLQDELLDILSAILSACKLNLADVAIVNAKNQQVNEAILKTELKPSSVLLFGLETSEIGLPFTMSDYKIYQFNNCSYLQAASLEKMKGNSNDAKVEKSKLWVCLKTLFNI